MFHSNLPPLRLLQKGIRCARTGQFEFNLKDVTWSVMITTFHMQSNHSSLIQTEWTDQKELQITLSEDAKKDNLCRSTYRPPKPTFFVLSQCIWTALSICPEAGMVPLFSCLLWWRIPEFLSSTLKSSHKLCIYESLGGDTRVKAEIWWKLGAIDLAFSTRRLSILGYAWRSNTCAIRDMKSNLRSGEFKTGRDKVWWVVGGE